MNAPRRVAITGLGVITPLGNSPETFFTSLMEGKSGIDRLKANFIEQLDCKIAAQCNFNALDYFGKHHASTLDRSSQFALVAAQQAVDDAELQFSSLDRTRTGVSIGTIEADLTEFDELYTRLFKQGAKRLKPLTILMNMNSSPASHIAMKYELLGFNLTYSVACSSSAVAIGEAFEKIRYGLADVMLAGGTESPLAFGFIKSWEALRVLAKEDENNPSMSCKPFAADRSGLVLGEGAAIVVLEEWNHAKARGAKIYGELTGYGCTNDPAHITKPSHERQAAAMQAALASANLTPDTISYINAHGTATPLNDATETAAIKQVFGDAAHRIPVSSTKSMHGHLMGATSAVEFIACVKALEHEAIPPTCNLFNPDPACDLDYVPNIGRTNVPLQHVMTNSFAFGGTSGVLIVSKYVL